MERLNKYIQSCGICSRRKADELIQKGLIKVNGKVVTELGYKININDQVHYNDKLITKTEELVYFLCNKPRGVVSTRSDEKNRKTILELLPEKYKNFHIFPVGRLDYDTTGCILLTNDGKLTNYLTHPKYQIEKEYQVRIEGLYTLADMLNLKKGIFVETEDEKYFVKPKDVEILEKDKETNSSIIKIILTEGKNHEVKNIFKTQGYKVLKLTRLRFAFLDLNLLAKGSCRELKIHEVKKLYGLSKQNNK